MSTASVILRCVILLTISFGTTAAFAAESNGTTFNGAMPGAFSVSPNGAATYSIPLEVPPGIGGMTPQLSLGYNSQSGNGLLGVGWSLGGLSAITRCPATLAQDNLIDGVDFDANDRFCLDGQRLITVTNAGCAGGTEYRTEIDSYARVCSYGTAGVGPAWFKVWTKAGQVMEYANTADSGIEAQGVATVLIWAVNRIEDAAGNYLKVSYLEDNANGEYHAERIDYAGNDLQGMAPYHSVQFIYEARSDISRGYIAGRQMQTSVRLTNVQVNAGYNTIRDYRLTYATGATTGRSRITSLQQCDGIGTSATCLPETALTWSAGAASFSGVLNTGRSNAGYQTAQPLDVNGDGKTDLAYCTSATTNWQILISTGSGLNAPIDTGILCTNYQYAALIDYDTDGSTDLLLPYANSRFYVLSWDKFTGNSFTLVDTGIASTGYNNKPVVMDINGDGQDDLALAYNSAWYLRINNGNGFNAAVATGIASTNFTYRQKIDYDADGLDDLLVPYANSRWYVLRSTSSTFQLIDTGRANTGYDKTPQVMDVDGDGRQDLVYNNSTQKVIYFNRGNTFSGGVGTGIGTQWATTTFPLDYNGDGKMDLIMPGAPGGTTANNWYVLQSTGASFTVINTGIASNGYATYPKPGDYNGDGFVDIALAYSSVWMLRPHATGVADQVTAIRDGLDNQINITYKALTESGIYSSRAAFYPSQGIRAPMRVVSGYATSNGLGGSYGRSYYYNGALVDLQGRGFLGFDEIIEKDPQTNTDKYTEYRTSFPYVGQIEFVETHFNGVLNNSQAHNTWSYSQPYPGVYQIYLATSTEHTYEPNEVHRLVSTVTTANAQYDAYGNPGQIAVTSTDGLSGDSYSKTTVNTFDNDTVQWHLSRLSSATVTSTTPSGTQTRSSAFEYDPAKGLLTAEIIEPGDPQSSLRTEYAYDGFGNKTSVTVKDSGSNAYPIATATSTTNADYSQLAVSGTYTVTSTNAKGHSETQVIDARFGKPLSLAGPNGLTTQWAYDSFGRQTTETRADGTTTTVTSNWCDSSCAGVANAVYMATTQSSGAASASVYFDGLGREVRSAAVSLDGRSGYKDTLYNNLGQVTRVSRPYFAGATPQWSDNFYDTLGRVMKETAPDGGIVETTHHGLATHARRYDINNTYNQTVTQRANVEGNLVEVIDEGNQPTRYEYDPFGNLTRVTDPANNATVMAYDARGRKTSMDDPDMGHWEYKYDALGQLRWQKDAKNQIVTMTYDVLGRMISRVEPEGTSTWTYDQAGSKGIGKLWKVAGPNNYSETYTYDPLGRPSQTSQVMAGNTFNTTTGYDSLSRVDTLTYPSGFQLKHNYNARGYLDKVSNAANTSEAYWTAQSVSPDGQITSELLGNGVQTVRSIDPASGRMTYLGSYAGATNVQMLTYQYDALGNLKSRDDAVQTLNETFTYDGYNRLKTTNIAGVGTKTWNYNSLGNITSKDGYTDYTYGTAGTKPHAVTAARGNTYSYDANGNLTGGAGRLITWNSANLPTRIVTNTAIAEFKYGPDRSRYQQLSTVNGVGTTTLYVGKLYEQVSVGTQTTYKNYIHAGGRVVAIRETVNSGAPTTKYLHQDHLGSTDVITGSTGQVLERTSFDAFGTRRIATTWRDPVTAILGLYSTRGFTGHEQLDTVGLIHMNGRVYDPELGRFISADPTVQSPGNAQSLNRYSYVVNNPLALTDPSGYLTVIGYMNVPGLGRLPIPGLFGGGRFLPGLTNWLDDEVWQPIGDSVGVDKKDFMKYGAPLIAIVVAPYAGLYIGTTYGLSTAAGYAISGATAGLIASGGDPRAALVGAATGGLYGVGGTLGGMVGSGVNGYLQTGSVEGFARGFAAGAIPQDMGFGNAYLNNPFANIGIGIARDGVRGAITADSRDGILPGIAFGQANNAVGHLVGFATTRTAPKFDEGAFIYEGGFWKERGAITFGNVISGREGLSSNTAYSPIYTHERDHIFNPVERGFGVLYIPAHAMDLSIGKAGEAIGRGYDLYPIEEHVQSCPYSRLLVGGSC